MSEISVIMGGNHNKGITTYPFKTRFLKESPSHDNLSIKGIEIESDSWIGLNVTILDGVKISVGTIVGAGAVVARTTDPYGIYVGNPARKIGARFDENKIQQLLDSKWWEFSKENLISLVDKLYSTDVTIFLEALREVREEETNGNQ